MPEESVEKILHRDPLQACNTHIEGNSKIRAARLDHALQGSIEKKRILA